MTFSEARSIVVETLSPVFGEQESIAIFRFLMRDFFSHISQVELFSGRIKFHSHEVELLYSLLHKLKSGQPYAYVSGFTDFCGLRIMVNSHVLIPRPETEEIVDWALKEHRHMFSVDNGIRILDLCSGSGCIALAMQKRLPGAKVFGADVSTAALEVARSNASALELPVEFFKMDVLNDPFPDIYPVHLMISNPPYIPVSESVSLHVSVSGFEPHLALFVEDENSDVFYHRIMQFAAHYLIPGGLLFFELHAPRAKYILEYADSLGIFSCELRNDLSGLPRMLKLQRNQA